MLRRITVPYNLNTYFLACKKFRKAVIIKLGGRVEKIADFILKNDIIPDKILLFHGHADQLFSMGAFKKNAPARVTIPGHFVSGLDCGKQGVVHVIIGLGQGGQIVGDTEILSV